MQEHWGWMKALEEHHTALLERQAKSQAQAIDTDHQVLDTVLDLAGVPMPSDVWPSAPAAQGPLLPSAALSQPPPGIWEKIFWCLPLTGSPALVLLPPDEAQPSRSPWLHAAEESGVLGTRGCWSYWAWTWRLEGVPPALQEHWLPALQQEPAAVGVTEAPELMRELFRPEVLATCHQALCPRHPHPSAPPF